MSIVDFTSQQQPSFSYSNTAMSAWLCETYSPGVIPNNGPTQGQLFYFQFSNTSQAGNSLTVNGMMNCQTAEGVGAAAPPSYTGKSTGHDAIVQDMTANGFLGGIAYCKSRH